MRKGTLYAVLIASLFCCSTEIAAAPPDSWESVPLPIPFHTIADVWCDSPSCCYAVGQAVGQSVIFRFDGDSWKQDLLASGAFYSVWGNSCGDVYAVGSESKLYHRDGDSWSSQSHPPTSHLRGTWGTGPGSVYAVGDGGVVLHEDGDGWAFFDPPPGTSRQFEAVWAASPSCLYAVGSGGGVHRFDGTNWSIIPASANFLTGLWGTSCDDFYATGHVGSTDAGIFYHCNSSSCQQICGGPFGSRPRVPQLWSVMGSGADIYAVGGRGVIAHWDGTTCTPLDNGLTDSHFLSGIWANATCDIYVGGRRPASASGGVVLHSSCPPTDFFDSFSEGINEERWKLRGNETGANCSAPEGPGENIFCKNLVSPPPALEEPGTIRLEGQVVSSTRMGSEIWSKRTFPAQGTFAASVKFPPPPADDRGRGHHGSIKAFFTYDTIAVPIDIHMEHDFEVETGSSILYEKHCSKVRKKLGLCRPGESERPELLLSSATHWIDDGNTFEFASNSPVPLEEFADRFVTLVVTVQHPVNCLPFGVPFPRYEAHYYIVGKDAPLIDVGTTCTEHDPRATELQIRFNVWWKNPSDHDDGGSLPSEETPQFMYVDWVYWTDEILDPLVAHETGETRDTTEDNM